MRCYKLFIFLYEFHTFCWSKSTTTTFFFLVSFIWNILFRSVLSSLRQIIFQCFFYLSFSYFEHQKKATYIFLFGSLFLCWSLLLLFRFSFSFFMRSTFLLYNNTSIAKFLHHFIKYMSHFDNIPQICSEMKKKKKKKLRKIVYIERMK